MSDEVSPTTRYLKERAAHYRALAAKEQNKDKAADYLNRAQILERATEPAPPTPAARADVELAERHVREGAERVAAQLALVEKLDANGHDGESSQARELLGTLTETLSTSRRHLQIIRDARKRRG